MAKGGPVLMAKGGILLVAGIGILYLTIYKKQKELLELNCCEINQKIADAN